MNNETAQIIKHYLRQIVRRADLSGFDEIEAEIDAAIEADERARTNERIKQALTR